MLTVVTLSAGPVRNANEKTDSGDCPEACVDVQRNGEQAEPTQGTLNTEVIVSPGSD